MSTPPEQSERRPDPYELPGYEPTAYEPRDDEYGFEEPQRDYRPVHPEPAWRSLARKLFAPIAFVVLLLWKFKFIFVAIFKLKLFTVAASMPRSRSTAMRLR